MSTQLLEFKKGQVICRQGDFELCMYDIRYGSVKIYVNYQQENETLLTTLTAGEYFGEMGMIESRPRSATAVCAENNTKIMRIESADFDSYFSESPAKVFAIMQHMSSRIRELTKDYMDACQAAAELMEAEKENKEKSPWLKGTLTKLASIYNNGK